FDRTQRRAYVDTVDVQQPSRLDDRAVDLVGGDLVRGRTPREQRALPAAAVGQHDAQVPGTVLDANDAAYVDVILAQQPQRELRPQVAADLADVARAQAEPRACDHRRGRHAAALDFDSVDHVLRVGLREAVDDRDQVERVDAQPDDIEGTLVQRHDVA